MEVSDSMNPLDSAFQIATKGGNSLSLVPFFVQTYALFAEGKSFIQSSVPYNYAYLYQSPQLILMQGINALSQAVSPRVIPRVWPSEMYIEYGLTNVLQSCIISFTSLRPLLFCVLAGIQYAAFSTNMLPCKGSICGLSGK